MLVLSRERFERIVVDERITIKVERLGKGTVRLKITPPGGRAIAMKKEGEIVIDYDRIKVRVIKFTGEKVEFGITAPKTFGIRRGELPKRET
jgi:sRNA-binding carbon storage regulator CsrA